MIDDLKTYSALRDTHLPWVGAIPADWTVFPNRALMRRRKVLVGDRYPEYTLLSLTKQGVIIRDVESGKGKFSADMSAFQEVRPGDLVFCLFDVPETPRTVGRARDGGMITGAYTIFECSDPTLAAFLEWFYRAMDDRKLLSPLYSGLRNTIPVPRFLSAKTPVPSPAERRAIVRFLSYANHAIQGAIQSQRKLIALLIEQRQGIVEQALRLGAGTRSALSRPLGSTPNFEVNAAWRSARLWAVASLRSETGDASLPLLSVFLGRGVIPYDEGGGQVHKPSLDLSAYQLVYDGDLVLNNQQAWRGSVGVSKHAGVVSPAYVVLRLSDALDSDFADYLFQSRVMVSQFVTSSKGVGDIQRDVHIPWLKNVRLPIPPLDEQRAIAVQLDAMTSDLARRLRVAEREISLLHEFRMRLVTDVVTGKLDVREIAARLPDEVDEPEPPDEADVDEATGEDVEELEPVEV